MHYHLGGRESLSHDSVDGICGHDLNNIDSTLIVSFLSTLITSMDYPAQMYVRFDVFP